MGDPFGAVSRALDRSRRVAAVAAGRPRRIRDPNNPKDADYLRAMHPDFDEVMCKADVDYRTRCHTDAGFASKFRIPPLIEPTRAFRQHVNSVDAVCWGPDKGAFISASHDGTLRVWDASNGSCLDTLKGHPGAVYHCAASSSRQIVVSCGAGASSNVLLWRWPQKKVVQSLEGHQRSVVHAALSADGGLAATCDQDGMVVVHDLVQGKSTMQRSLHLGMVYGSSFCRQDPNLLCSVGVDGHVQLVDLREQPASPWPLPSVVANCVSLQHSRGLFAAHDGRTVHCVEYLDRDTVLTGGADHKMKRWDLRAVSSTTPVCAGEYLGHTSTVRCLTASQDGRFVVSGCEDGSLRVWRRDALEEVRTALKASRQTLQQLNVEVQDLALAPEIRRELNQRRSELNDTIAVERAREEQLVRDGYHAAVRALHGHVGFVSGCAWLDGADGRSASVLSSSWDQTVLLFHVHPEELTLG